MEQNGILGRFFPLLGHFSRNFPVRKKKEHFFAHFPFGPKRVCTISTVAAVGTEGPDDALEVRRFCTPFSKECLFPCWEIDFFSVLVLGGDVLCLWGCQVGVGRRCALLMRVPNPSPVLD